MPRESCPGTRGSRNHCSSSSSPRAGFNHPNAGDRRGHRDECHLARGARLRGPWHRCRPARGRTSQREVGGSRLASPLCCSGLSVRRPDQQSMRPRPWGPFEFVFDRGCFHVFDEPEERARFAARVAAILAPGGLWLSLIGSTEGPPREVGPPRHTGREVTLAIEPALEIVELRAAEFRAHGARAWFWLSRCRAVAGCKW